MHPVQLALHHLEASIGTKRHLYINRLIEGYDAPGDSVFLAWKTLYNDWQMIKEKIDIENYASKSSLSNDVDPIINSILRYPSVQRKSKPARKKLELPKHMTGKEALEILKLQEEEKRRAEIVKEANRQKRDAKKNGEKTKKVVRRKRKKSIQLENSDVESEKEEPEERDGARKSIRSLPKRKYRDGFSSNEEEESENSSEEAYDAKDNECGRCGGIYRRGELWIQCDSCEKWYHAKCTDQRKKCKGQLDNLTSWRCDACEVEK